MMYYSTVNLVNVVTLDSVSTEDTLYVKENLYCGRPSKPFKFTAAAAQWIKINLGAAQTVNVAALFNHTFTATVDLDLLAYSDAWITSIYNQPMAWRQYDLYKKLNQPARWWQFTVTEPVTPLPQIGELWLGALGKFANARIQPGREDGVEYIVSEQQTAYGQDWDAYLSENKRFRITLKNINTPSALDDLEIFLNSIHGAAGRFLLIPDHRLPHVYYVKVVGSPSAQRLVYNPNEKELRQWSLELKVLTRGITLL